MRKRVNDHHDQPRDKRGRWALLVKCERISFRCTQAEFEAIMRRCEVLDSSISRYMLWLVSNDIVRNVRPR